MIKVWTDGSCIPNPGKGGYAWISECGKKGVGFEPASTNQRMEMKAVIEALRSFPKSSNIHVHTDSQFVINGATVWSKKWLKNGWITQSREPVKNKDLWEEMISLMDDRYVIFTWVKGHDGNKMNEKVNQMANLATGATDKERREMSERMNKGY